MKLISQFELAVYSIPELHGLYQNTMNALVQSNPDSCQRRNALASLENISREIAHKKGPT